MTWWLGWWCSFLLETTGKSGVGETGDLCSPLGGASSELIHQSCALWTESVSCTCGSDPDSGMSQSWEWCPVPHQSLPCLPSLGGWIPAALPVSQEPLHLKLLQIPSELPWASISWRFDRLTFLLQFTCLKAFDTHPLGPSLYYRGLVL